MSWVTEAERTAAAARAAYIESWSEKELQEHIVGIARALGWWAYHTYNSRGSAPGYPDLHLIHVGRGISMFRELKTKKGRLSPAQVEVAAAMRDVGLDYAVWRPADVISGAVVQQLQGTA